MKLKFIAGALAGALTISCLVVEQAQADTVKFYNGGAGYGGIFNGAGTVYADTSGNPTDCPVGSPTCTSGGAPDIISTPQVFISSTVITATPNAGQNVWNDLSPLFAGLGVGSGPISDDDQILGTDALTISFLAQVTLTGVGTLFDPNHNPFGTFANNTVTGANTFLLNGVSTRFDLANLEGLSLIGHDFTFRQEEGQPSFYVSALQFRVTPQEDLPGTPIPGAVWLFGTVIAGGAGYGRWRRQRKQVA